MCLAVPGKVVNLFEADGVQMGKMDFDGITKNICLAYVPDIKVGEYAIVHVVLLSKNSMKKPQSKRSKCFAKWVRLKKN